MAQKRQKHNKKRNTAFLYEALIKELTKTIVARDDERKEVIVALVKENFSFEGEMGKELECYRNLLETYDLNDNAAEKLIYLVKEAYSQIDKEKLFAEQTKLINVVNKALGAEVFSNFVPNYKDLATVYQIFNNKGPLKSRVLLEENLVTRITSAPEVATESLLKPVDNLVYSTFVKKFNEKYSGTLLESQQTLLSTYILSFTDNGIDLKTFMNEEVRRLKDVLSEALRAEEVESDPTMLQKTKAVLALLETFGQKRIDNGMIKKVLKTQQLVSEISDNG
tara:strand:- start:1039 stop:1878 length:840 start_codon:yes stop_codon:yes gene_type:complete